MQEKNMEKLATAKQIEEQLGVDAYDDVMLMTDEEYTQAYQGESKIIFGNDAYFYQSNIGVTEQDLQSMKPKVIDYIEQVESFMQTNQMDDIGEIEIRMQLGILDNLLFQCRKLMAQCNNELSEEIKRYDAIKDVYLKSEFMKEEIHSTRILISKVTSLETILKDLINKLNTYVEDDKYDR